MVYVETKVPEQPASAAQLGEAWLARIAPERGAGEMEMLHRAVALAQSAHSRQIRASGEPYLLHAVAVADILAGLHLDAETLAAAILHDVVEDSELTLEDVSAATTPAVAHLVDGVTKMKIIRDFRPTTGAAGKEGIRLESLRKLLLAMAEDVRVVLIKLADRLHNMRTLRHLPEEKRRRIARETLDIYAPLANRLGIWQAKWELEDLAFRYLEPATYKQIARFLDERRIDRQRYIEQVATTLRGELGRAGIEGEVQGRPKHLYSIWKKMQRKGIGFHQLFDVRAVRIRVETVADCYHALGVVHTLWPHIPREFDDYIATPKENLYRSIHTAVIGPEGKTLEVQIRTWEMDRHAELGVAAHWRYKEGGRADQDFEQKVAWLRQVLEWRDEEHSAGDFIDRFKSEVFQDRVYVLTPQGEVVDLQQGATPLDFAYHIHTELGHRCRGAKVDGRIVPLTYELKSGEQVEILTTRHGAPSRDWINPHLGYLKTSRARSKARHWFKQQDQEQNLTAGRLALDRELRRLGVSDLSLEKLAEEAGYSQVDDLLVAVGRGDVNSVQIARAVHALIRPRSPLQELPETPPRRTRPSRSGADHIRIRGVGNLLTSTARCCKPAPGDPIVGYITQGRGVTVHRSDCPNILRLNEEKRARLIEVEWNSHEEPVGYPVDIEVLAIDRQGLLRDVTSLLANEKINLLTVNTQTDRKSLSARMLLTLEVVDTDQLSAILTRIGQLPNVLETRRLG